MIGAVGKSFREFGGDVYVWDADALAAISAIENDASPTILTDNQKEAINDLITGVKPVWSKVKVLNGFIGETANSQKYNWKDPRNLDAAFRLKWHGSYTYTSAGAVPNGTNAYAEILLNPLTHLTTGNYFIGFYTNSNAQSNPATTEIGCADASSNIFELVCNYLSNSQGVFEGTQYWSNQNGLQPVSDGLFSINRQSGTLGDLKNNNYLLKRSTTNVTKTLTNIALFLHARNGNGTPSRYSSRTAQFLIISDGLTESEFQLVQRTIEQYQAKIARTVISKTFTLTNTNSVAISNNLVQINLTNSDFNLTKMLPDATDIRFNNSLSHDLDFLDIYNNRLSMFVRMSCNAVSSQSLIINHCQSSISHLTFANIRQRKQVIDQTLSLYDFTSVSDLQGVGADFTLNNATLTTGIVGNVLSTNGTTAFPTCALTIHSGTIGQFSFCFYYDEDKYATGVIQTIFCKYWSVASYIRLQINEYGFYQLVIRVNGGTVRTVTIKNSILHKKDKIHYFSLRYTQLEMMIHIDDYLVHHGVKISTTGGAALTWGAFNDGTTQNNFCKVNIFDVELIDDVLLFVTELERVKCLNYSNIFNKPEQYKWVKVGEIMAPLNSHEYGESSVLYEGGIVKVWYKHNYPVNVTSVLEYITSSDQGVTWSAPVNVLGNGVGGEAGLVIRPYVFKDDGAYYCIYCQADGINPNLPALYASSPDGITWTKIGQFLPGTYGTNQNMSVFNDNGVYKGLVEVGTGANGGSPWILLLIEGNSLATMAFKTGTNISPSLVIPGVPTIAGGPMLYKTGNIYHIILHSNVPSNVFHWVATDVMDVSTYKLVNTLESFTLESINSYDQAADISVCEGDNISFAVLSNYWNTSPLRTNLSIYKYNGTLAQLINDVTLT